MFKFKKIKFLFVVSLFLFGFTAINFSAYSHWNSYLHWHDYRHWPPPVSPPIVINPIPVPWGCAYGYGSTCQTYSGRICSTFAMNPQPTWFTSCFGVGFFQACVNVPTFSVPFVQNICYQMSTPCTCHYGFINGHYMYENGFII